MIGSQSSRLDEWMNDSPQGLNPPPPEVAAGDVRWGYYLVGGGDLLAVDGEGQQAGGQVDQAAHLQVHVAAAGGVGATIHLPGPHHVAVTTPHPAAATPGDQGEKNRGRRLQQYQH